MRAVLQALGRLYKKEDLSAVLTVFHVQKEKSVMKQVISQSILFMSFAFLLSLTCDCNFLFQIQITASSFQGNTGLMLRKTNVC